MSQETPPETQSPGSVSPVQPGERITFVDILRGFAVFGILVANMASFSGHTTNLLAQQAAVDQWVLILIRFFITAKFYSLFSFLFGWGLSVQMERARARGSNFSSLYLRRLLILVLIGILHGVLIWSGDILTLYAILGFLLFLTRNRSERTILIFVALCLLLPILLNAPWKITTEVASRYEDLTAFLRLEGASSTAYSSGTYLEITQLRIQEYLRGLSSFLFYFGNIFSMFLLGLWAGKRRIFQEADQHLPLLKRVLVGGLLIGVLGNALNVWLTLHPNEMPVAWMSQSYHQMVQRIAYTLGAPALMLFYVTGIILLVRKKYWQNLLSPLANVGRMALSNYLFQSVLGTLIFYNYGLGLYGELSPTVGLIITVFVFLIQIRISRWWFDRHRYGPVEWLWRFLTYGRSPQALTVPGKEPGRIEKIWLSVKRLHPAWMLSFAWIILLLWAGLLVNWHQQIKAAGRASPLSFVSAPTAAPTQAAAEPDAEEQTGEETQGSTALLELPQIPYLPLNSAARGDVDALVETFDVELALSEIETLTGAPYLGRQSGSPQGWAAGDYIASQFASYGLLPFGEQGTYFQEFPVLYTPLEDTPRLYIPSSNGSAPEEFVAYQDFSPVVRWYAGSGVGEGQVYWLNTCTEDDFTARDVVGSALLCLPGTETNWLAQRSRLALEHSAAALLFLMDPETRPPDFGWSFKDTWVPEPLPVFFVYPDMVNRLLSGSETTLPDLLANAPPFPLESTLGYEIQTLYTSTCPGTECVARNVVGILPGRDPAYAGEAIILGAHYDHMGQTPNGIVFPGANDDASGVAVLMEIARSWHEQGYIPRRSVIFAAWDAEEQGLFGAIHYVQHPPFPLENTVAMLQLDMVGTGTARLGIDGNSTLNERVQYIAETLGFETALSNTGGSDHVPFQYVGVPASALIWEFNPDVEISYHQPRDTIQVIDEQRLLAASQITELTVLDLAESEPSIQEMLVARASAAQEGDLQAFLASSHSDQVKNDLYWFQDLQSLHPERVSLTAGRLSIAGNHASASVQIDVVIQESSELTQTLTARIPVSFTYESSGWKWSGPQRVWSEIEVSEDERTVFAVAYPPGMEEGVSDVGASAIEIYQRLTDLLGLSPQIQASLLIVENKDVLWGSTALSQSRDLVSAVFPGEVRLVYTEAISTSLHLQDSLVQLALAEAGVNEALAPWLWRGLPLVLQGYDQPISTQVRFLPALQESLVQGSPPADLVSSWAATSYLQESLGWPGLGGFISRLGEICQEDCDPEAALDDVLLEFIDLDATGFEAAWQSVWQNRLETAQGALDALLSERNQAISSGDGGTLLRTVDRSVPNLEVEETHWLADFQGNPPERFSIAGRPLAFLEGGSLLAEMTMEIQPAGGDSTSTTFTTLLTPSESGYYWAGPLMERLQGEWVDILYPSANADLAAALLAQAEEIVARFAAALEISQADKLIIKLYESPSSYRTSIAALLPPTLAENAWTSPGESIKLNLIVGGEPDDYTGTLANQLSHTLLYQRGVEPGWLVEGISAYLSKSYILGFSSRTSGMQTAALFEAVDSEEMPPLSDILPSLQLSGEELALDRGLARDAVDFMLSNYGWPALLRILNAQERGTSLENAFRFGLGIAQAQFEQDWRASLLGKHMDAEWAETAQAFTSELAMETVDFLTSPALAGRQAGSPGGDAAAGYIAEAFETYGLLPVGDVITDTTGLEGLLPWIPAIDPEADALTSYFQTFPITVTLQTSLPGLQILPSSGEPPLSLTYRQDFLLAQGDACQGTLSAPLVWGGRQEYTAVDLAGMILLRPTSSDPQVEIDAAISHGAAGLILTNSSRDPDDLFAKQPLTLEDSLEASIPVFVLTQPGYSRLLETLGHNRQSIARLDDFQPLEATVRFDCRPDSFNTVQSANVLGLLPGSDPYLRQEVIILGAHYDYVGDDPDGLRYSGANDNASGVAVLLEIARLMHEEGYTPKRSILFAAWGAQELGQVGSNDYLANPAFPLRDTIAMIQLDGVGGGDGFSLGVQSSPQTDSALTFYLGAAEGALQETLVYTNVFNESDDTSFRQAGIPSVLVSWRLANEDNLPDGLANAVHPDRLGVTGRMITLLLLALAR